MALTVIQINAQETVPSKGLLIGSWVLGVVPSFAGISLDDRNFLDSLPEAKAHIYTSQTNRTLIFGLNGEFGQIDGLGRRVGGTWKLQGRTLTITSFSGNVWVQQILDLDGNRLALRQSAKGAAQPILPVLYFTRIH